ncbi:MAG TPA: iron-sulfur cluster-binding domain-containing protein [Candidatus Angelobacter sp.]|nr:iron-sulfur cluster-binding domain-containing protein [Candidatus Angelobacter sp.]
MRVRIAFQRKFVRIAVSLTSAGLFVFLAGFNVWSMVTARGSSPRSSRLWTEAHRIAGYLFIALFAVFCYYMLLSVRGWPDELPPRIIFHAGLALLLVPLLLVKVMVARYQKAARGLLTALGIVIFTSAFTLVAVNVAIHFLRDASAKKIPGGISIAVVVGILATASVGYLGKVKQTRSKSDAGSATVNRTASRPDVLQLTLARIEPQAPDARTLRFLLPRGQSLSARPGQFLTFEWMIEERPVNRSYSICSSPLQGGYVEITPKRVENGCVSVFLNDHAQTGLTVKARGPYGRFCFDEAVHQRIVLIAAGSGITPMVSMLRYIDDLALSVDTTLIYCARSERDEFFKNELAAMQQRLKNFHYCLVLSQPGFGWEGRKGRLRREILEQAVQSPHDSTFFLCGPSGFMDLARSLLKELAIEPSRILRESFGGAVAEETGASLTSGSIEVSFSRSPAVFKVSPADTLLESSERNGVLIPSGCRQGDCHTCITRLLSGRVHMAREDALSDDLKSQGFILPCISRPLTDVTLDA